MKINFFILPVPFFLFQPLAFLGPGHGAVGGGLSGVGLLQDAVVVGGRVQGRPEHRYSTGKKEKVQSPLII